MGNEQQKPNQIGEIPLTISHPKFNNCKIVPSNDRKEMQITMGVDDKQYDKWKENLAKATLDKRLFFQKGIVRKYGNFKSKLSSIQLNFDNFPYLLTEQIYNRNGRKSKFEEWQLWYLLLSLASAQQEMKRGNGSKVGDIRPQNIFLNAKGDVKVSNLLSWPKQYTSFNKTFDNQKTYLAPEEMLRLEMGQMEDTTNYSSQVFSIGFTILSAAMLEDFLDIYNIKSNKFDYEKANSLIKEWRSNSIYSQIFTAVISNLCQFKPEKRLDEQELWDFISHYIKPIKNKDDFVIEEAPLKVQQQLEEIRKQFAVSHPPQSQLFSPQIYQTVTMEKNYAQPFFPQTYVSPKTTSIPRIPQSYKKTLNQKYLESYNAPISAQIPSRGLDQMTFINRPNLFSQGGNSIPRNSNQFVSNTYVSPGTSGTYVRQGIPQQHYSYKVTQGDSFNLNQIGPGRYETVANSYQNMPRIQETVYIQRPPSTLQQGSPQ